MNHDKPRMPVKLKHPAQKRDVFQASPTLTVWQLNNRWQKELKTALVPLNLTYIEFVLLAVLVFDMRNQTWSQNSVALTTKIDKMVVSQALRSLENKGFLNRQTNVIDNRNVNMRVSGQGILLAKKAVKMVKTLDKRLRAELKIDHRAAISISIREPVD